MAIGSLVGFLFDDNRDTGVHPEIERNFNK
jgi:hypothetical protein